MSPDRFRGLISAVLIGGVAASALLILLGFITSLLVGWDGSLTGAPAASTAPTDFSGVLGGLRQLRPIALAQAGLLVLLATPVLRVATSVVGFALEFDWLYTVITLGVLAILLLSLFVVR
jgi:uncharacterized membrane protein